MTSGRVSDVGQVLPRKLKSTSQILQEHIVLSINATNGEVHPYDDADFDNPIYGVTVRSTKSRIDQSIGKTVYLTGTEREDEAIAIIRTGIVDVALDVDHGLIRYGDAIYVNGSDGTCKHGTQPNTLKSLRSLVGFAEEGIAAPAAGTRTQETVRVSLALMNGSSL